MFSGEILDLIRKRDMGHSKSQKTMMIIEYKSLRNLSQRKISRKKREYVKNLIEENQKTVENSVRSLHSI